MPGHYVHGAWAPCLITEDRLYADRAFVGGNVGTMIIVSTPAHDLREYLVWTSDGTCPISPLQLRWAHSGKMRELFI